MGNILMRSAFLTTHSVSLFEIVAVPLIPFFKRTGTLSLLRQTRMRYAPMVRSSVGAKASGVGRAGGGRGAGAKGMLGTGRQPINPRDIAATIMKAIRIPHFQYVARDRQTIFGPFMLPPNDLPFSCRERAAIECVKSERSRA